MGTTEEAELRITLTGKDKTGQAVKGATMNIREMGEKISGIGLRMSAAFTLPVLALGRMILANKEVQETLKPVVAEWDKLKTGIAQAVLPLIREALPGILQFIGTLEKGVAWFANLDKGTQKTILFFVGLVAAIGPVLTIFGQILSVVGTLQMLLPGLGAMFGSVFGFIGTTLLPIVAVIAALGLLIKVITDNWALIQKFGAVIVYAATGKLPDWAWNIKESNGALSVGNLAKLAGNTSGAYDNVNAGMAGGGSFVVPPGYPNDSFRLGLTSGEPVTVGRRGSAGNTVNIVLPAEAMFWSDQQLERKFAPIVKRIMHGA